MAAPRRAEAFRRFAEHPEFARIRAEAGLPDPSAVAVSPVHTVGWAAPAHA